MSSARFSGKISFATSVQFFPRRVSGDVSKETIFCYHSIFFLLPCLQRGLRRVLWVSQANLFCYNRDWFCSKRNIFAILVHYGSKSGILVEIDFALNKTFFAPLILYGRKSWIWKANLHTCRALEAGDPGEISPRGRPSLPKYNLRRYFFIHSFFIVIKLLSYNITLPSKLLWEKFVVWPKHACLFFLQGEDAYCRNTKKMMTHEVTKKKSLRMIEVFSSILLRIWLFVSALICKMSYLRFILWKVILVFTKIIIPLNNTWRRVLDIGRPNQRTRNRS
jgi:hypothetical protein